MLAKERLELLKKSVPMYVYACKKMSVQKRGDEYWTNCPFHDDKTPSFSMYKAPDGAWMFKCFGCGKSGNIFQLVQKVENVSFEESVKIVESMMMSPEWEEKKSAADSVFSPIKEKAEKLVIPIESFDSYMKNLESNPDAIAWLSGRGISLETAKQFCLGYVNTPLSTIVPSMHPWSNKGWVLFPEVRSGNVISVKYRSIQGKKIKTGDKHWSGFAQRKDMVASPLYNQDAITPFEDILIVEGEPDCIILGQAGFSCVALPSAGFSPTSEMREHLMSSHARFLAGDTDEVGLVAMNKLFKELGGDDPKSKTYLVKWPAPYKDANEVFLKHCKSDIETFRKLVFKLMEESKDNRVPGIQDLKTVLNTADFKPTHDSPNRLFFPWPNINKWVDILPGEVMFMFATETKQGKSTWLMNILVENALRGKKIINFSAELTPARYAQMTTAYLLKKNRNTITEADAQEAAKKIPNETFYIGYKPGAKLSEVLKVLADAKQVYGGDVFVVDPLHFLIRGVKDENVAFAAAMRALVDFSIKWNVIVIVVGQARKSMAGSRGKMAQGQDARGTAALGEDAATTWVLHRDRKEKSVSEGGDGEPVFEALTKIKLDYSRNSEPMSTKLIFRGETATFSPYSMEASPISESEEISV